MLLPLLFLNSSLGTLFPPICKRLPGLSPFFFRWTLSFCYMPTSLYKPASLPPPFMIFFFVASPCKHTISTHVSITNNIWCVQTLHTSLALTPWTRVHTLFRTWASHLKLNVPSHSSAPRPSIRSPRSPQSTLFLSRDKLRGLVIVRQPLLTTFRCSLFPNAYLLRHPGPSIFRTASSLKCNNK